MFREDSVYRSLFGNMLNGLAYCRLVYEGEGEDDKKAVDFIYLMVDRKALAYTYSMSLVTYFYECAFNKSSMRGYGAAITVVLAFIIMIVTVIQMIFRKRWVRERSDAVEDRREREASPRIGKLRRKTMERGCEQKGEAVASQVHFC